MALYKVNLVTHFAIHLALHFSRMEPSEFQ